MSRHTTRPFFREHTHTYTHTQTYQKEMESLSQMGRQSYDYLREVGSNVWKRVQTNKVTTSSEAMLQSTQEMVQDDLYQRLPDMEEIQDTTSRWKKHKGDDAVDTSSSSSSTNSLPSSPFGSAAEEDKDYPSPPFGSQYSDNNVITADLPSPDHRHGDGRLSYYRESIRSLFAQYHLPPYQPEDTNSTSSYLYYHVRYGQTVLLQETTKWCIWENPSGWTGVQALLAVAVLVVIMWRCLLVLLRRTRQRGGGGAPTRERSQSTGGIGAGRPRRRNSKVLYAGGRSLTFQASSGAIVEEASGGGGGGRTRKNSSSGIEILRTGVGRGRFGTFDFFGMNESSTAAANRRRNQSTDSFGDMDNNSIVDLGGRRSRHNSRGGSSGPVTTSGTNNNFRRERLGSMDVYLTEGTLGGISNHRKNTDASPYSNMGPAVPGEPYLSSTAIIDDEGGERFLYDEFGIVTLSHRVEYFGPSRVAFEYATFTPPTSWKMASRRIIPTDIMTKLERRLRLDPLAGKLTITVLASAAGHGDIELSLDEISMYVQRPLEGGVANLYVKGAPKEEWLEHTFKSANGAAQFQLDLLAYQMLGKTVRHIFEALNMIHQGSLAYDGPEFVLHDDSRNEKKVDGHKPLPKSVNATRCVAWDDAMRSLSSIPTVRIALERLWLSHRRPSEIVSAFAQKQKKEKGKDEEEMAGKKADKKMLDLDLLTEEYSKKRLLLGPMDFFRLFVPVLPDTAVPEGESNRGRMEQLLSWRKRVARAAVLVRSYTRARRVVNLGWHLDKHKPGESRDEFVTKRLAYDGNEDNNVHDTAAKNEVYEASVSRDVLCYVRPFDFLSIDVRDRTDSFVLSPYQAFSHVGSQYFKLTPKMMKFDKRDPVELFPSLRKIISENPNLDFLVLGVHLRNRNAMKLDLYVRSFAKSIDPQFDCVVDRFTEGREKVRDRKLHLMIQLGNRMGLSYAGWILLRLLSFLFQLTETGRNLPMALESTRDRYALPAFKVSSFFRTTHFGGAMQTNAEFPKNYVATICEASLDFLPNLIPRMLFARLQEHMSDSIVDFTYFLEGADEDELPERALCTCRQVHVHYDKNITDPDPHLCPMLDAGAPKEDLDDEQSRNSIQRLYENSINAVASIVGSPMGKTRRKDDLTPIVEDRSQETDGIPQRLKDSGNGLDPIEKAVDSVLDILGNVKVPSRVKPEDVDPDPPERLIEDIEETGCVVLTMMPVLEMFDRHDIERFVRECDFEIKDAAVRLVQTAAWRGRTFPIDKRRLRIDLQNGQFFHQGFDLEHNPVFYFRNMCKGPWRGDKDAVISAVLYRFEGALAKLTVENPRTKATLIILMGAPKKLKEHGDEEDESVLGEDDSKDEETGTASSPNSRESQKGISANDEQTNNPRISEDEQWKCHTSRSMIEQLYGLLKTHYPARLSKVLIVKGRGKNTYYKTKLEGRVKLNQVLDGSLNVVFANKTSELTHFVAADQLCSIVGGRAPVSPSSFAF